jgi:uncharacterized FlaG/YvyC family protein
MEIARLMSGTALSGFARLAPGNGTQTGSVERSTSGDSVKPASNGLKLKIDDQKPSVDLIETLREQMNSSVRSRLQIDRNDESGRFVYRILDPDTGETLRQWPPENYGDLVEFLQEKQGGLVNERA